jgi:CPA2 family monovalent cation:H+ antiporter-2
MGEELLALGGSFLAAGLLARLGRRVGLPTIPFFIAAGILTGPHTPGLVLFRDPHDLELFAAVGLILLLFHLGLEFSLDDLLQGGRPLLAAGAVYIGLNVGGGFLFGLVLGWGIPEALVIAGAVGISSSAIVTKLLVELHRLANPETRLILGIVVVEDVFLALYLAILQPVIAGSDSPAGALVQFGRAFAFLLALTAVARFGARWVGRLIHSADDELLTVLFVGLAIVVAGAAEEIGVSDAIGAFMVGLIVAGTSLEHRVERLVLPLRDAFAAVFFFAFGLTIDPSAVGGLTMPVVAAVLLSLALNAVAGLVSARIYGFGRTAAANVGLTILGRGEFSLVLATLAAAAGLDGRLGPFIGLYVLTLAVLGPLLASRSARLARFLPEGLFSGENRIAGAPGPARAHVAGSSPPVPRPPPRPAGHRAGGGAAHRVRQVWDRSREGRRRMERRVEDLREHTIVCAYGRVGRAAARELQAEEAPFVVIEPKRELKDRMRADGVLFLTGDPSSEPVLRQAGIERAQGLLCAVDSDATNVFITLTARSLNPDIYIVARASEAETPDRLRRAGANRVISPYRSSGQRMAHLVLRPRVVDSLELLGKRLQELVVESGSPLVGRTVGDACDGAVALLVHETGGETRMHPDAGEIVQAGDRILVWGDGDGSPALLERSNLGPAPQ